MKVLIPTAGIGSRLGELTSHYNKAMLPVGKRPVISHIIDLYPKNTEFVIALGYKGDYIRQYLELGYPKTNITFIDIDNFDGPGSGLGYTLRQCKPYLDQEFIFHTNDAIVIDEFLGSPMDNDTMFLFADCPDLKKYRTVSVDLETSRIIQVHDKTEKHLKNVFNYIGVAYIKNYKDFIEVLDGLSLHIGESEYFIRSLDLDKEIKAHFVDKWYDIGNVEQLRFAWNELADFKNLNKLDEAIYFKDTKVYKFSTDETFIQKRVERASLLNDLVPRIVASSKNFYVYEYVPGKLLSEEVSVLPDFRYLLNWSMQKIWKPIKLSKKDENRFENICFYFYYEKTMDRLDMYYSKHNYKDKSEIINGVQTPGLSEILEMIDWSDLKRGIPVLFHGDYHFENILRTESGFKLLDWRQSFGDEIRYGDLYYDLAKLLHGLIVNHSIIRDEQFTIQVKNQVKFDFHRKQSLLECEKYFRWFLKENSRSWEKTIIITSLIFLNIASLHHYPYSHFLYYLGKSMLWEILGNEGAKGLMQSSEEDSISK